MILAAIILVGVAINATGQTTKVYNYKHVTYNNGGVKGVTGGMEGHTITLVYDKNGALVKITDQDNGPKGKGTDVYVIDRNPKPTWPYDFQATGHSKRYPNMVYTFTHKAKGMMAEQFTINVKDKGGYVMDDGSKEKNVIYSDK